jgi:D-beta-D-heptose 7-phosphate kinase/D-beta-D-heptose 1-phosphate adenosyltransferase
MKEKAMGLGRFGKIIFDSETTQGRYHIVKIRKNNPDSVIVFATGCFDIAQPGHAIFAEQLRIIGGKKAVVVVGVGRDSTLKVLKTKGRPINPEVNRAYMVASYKDVDYVVLNNEAIGEGKVDFEGVLRALKPDVFVLNDDDSAIETKRNLCKKLGVIFRMVKRETPDFLTPVSSTSIIEKIKST